MKEPKSKLPWKKGDSRKFSADPLVDKEGNLVVIPLRLKNLGDEDGDYILEAANNYQEAVELIRYLVKRVEEGSIRSLVTYSKYKEFLNKIDHGSE